MQTYPKDYNLISNGQKYKNYLTIENVLYFQYL